MPAKIPIPPYARRLKNPPDPERIAEDLRARLKEGPVTLGAEELERIVAMLEILSGRCAAAYQVVGQLADRAGLFHDPAVVKVLDALAHPLIAGEILPFHPAPEKESEGKRVNSRRMKKGKSPS